jgi:tetratricopeptide (TPR) repeat protein
MTRTAASELEAEVGRIADEFLDRLQRGETPTVEEYAAAHPDLADVLRDVLPLVRDGRNTPAGDTATLGAGGGPPDRLGEYRIVREVGRGGMGIVYEAVQEPLGRRVALKVLPAAAHQPAFLERFRREARAAAKLHHTHIVPVFGAGEHDGIPYYAMQFIDGVGLDAVIRDGPAGPRRVGPATAARWAMQAAEALEHAHQQGVIHRDVKPANLMVDERGHLWVTDFGLAQVQGDPGLTATGDLLGTLRYMSPEQALAKPGGTDHRTDVYSLGVSLYELVTFRSPFSGRDRQELLRRIAFDEPAPPRRVNPAVPADLEKVIQKALAKEPAERYGSAQELADDLRRLLDDRPVLARRPTWAQQLLKWARRHQAAVLTAGVALVLFLTAAVAALAVSNALIRREKTRADDNLTRARRAVEDYLTRTAEDPQLKAANFHDLRKRLLTTAVPFYEEFARQQPGDPEARRQQAEAYRLLAFVRAEMGEKEQAVADYGQARAILAELADRPGVADVPRCRLEAARIDNHLGTLLRDLFRDADAEAAHRRAVGVLEPLVEAFPAVADCRTELAATHTSLGLLLFRLDRRDEAEAAYHHALDLLEPLAAATPVPPECRREQGRASFNLGLLLFRSGRFPEGEAAYRKSLGMWEELAGAFPDNLAYRESLAQASSGLASLLGKADQPAAAEAIQRKAVAVQRQLVDDFPAVPKYRAALAGYSGNLGSLWAELGRRADGVTAYRTALALQKKLADDFPNVPEYREDLGRTHNNLGHYLRELGRLADAEAIDREAVAIRERLVAEAGPGGPSSRLVPRRLDLGYSLNGLAQGLRQHGKPAEAEAAFRRALALREELAASGVPQRRHELAQTSNEYGRFLLEQGRLAEAEAAFQKAVALREHLAAESPSLPVTQQDVALAYTYFHLSLVLAQQGRSAEADAARRHALTLVEVDGGPDDAQIPGRPGRGVPRPRAPARVGAAVPGGGAGVPSGLRPGPR